MSQPIRTVAVIGSGVIGASWAALFLANGLRVVISEPAQGAEKTFEEYLSNVWPALQTSVHGCKVSFAMNYEFVTDLERHLPEVDFVQENGPERVEFKQNLMQMLDQHARPEVVIASSSSGLPSSQFIQKCSKSPGRILIGHPFNPPHLIPLVEVVPNPNTDDKAISTALEFYTSIGKRPILIRREVPGFVVNRLQAALNNEAYSLVSRGIVSAEDLDAAVTSAPGLRWALNGPFVINALGGGGGPNGFSQRIERLGPAIQSWEQDMLKHRFDWKEDELSVLNTEASRLLESVDWERLKKERDKELLALLMSRTEHSK